MRGDAPVRFGGRAEESDEPKDRHRASARPIAWRGQAGYLADSLAKGGRVMVTGRLRQRSWDPEGEKRSVAEIEADEVGASLKFAPPRSNAPATAATATAAKTASGRPNAAATSTTHRHAEHPGFDVPGACRGVVASAFMLDPGQQLHRPVVGGKLARGESRQRRGRGTASDRPRACSISPLDVGHDDASERQGGPEEHPDEDGQGHVTHTFIWGEMVRPLEVDASPGASSKPSAR